MGRGKVGTGEKKVGEEKSMARREAPRENVSSEKFLTVSPVLDPDWRQQLDKRLRSFGSESEGARELQTVVRYVRLIQIFW